MPNTNTIDASKLKEELIVNSVKKTSEQWISQLNSRKKAELEFHNQHRDKAFVQNQPQDTYELLHGNKIFYLTTQLSNTYIDRWIKENSAGKIFLDYACGNGDSAMKAAQSGASLSIGIDISDISVTNAKEAAANAGLDSQCVFLQGDCENTGLPNNSIDVVLCSGMLHHLDLSFAFPELRRILKPGGKILAVEALNYNPVIKAYRELTPSMRTEWEKGHILSLKDVRFASRFFGVSEVRYWHLFSIAGAFLKKFPTLQKHTLGVLNFLDQLILKIPFVQLMAWQFTFVLTKKEDK